MTNALPQPLSHPGLSLNDPGASLSDPGASLRHFCMAIAESPEILGNLKKGNP
ncbi:MAG: hypothetical protein HC890_15110 [Chloroflexaceae bacterium]|nr:hypothetical protein [Chloroflexaceae bacterium]